MKNSKINIEIRSNVNKGVTAKNDKKAGVIQTILTLICKKEQTQKSILKVLVKTFPEREVDAMEKTIKAQIGTTTRPTRMERERGVEFKIVTRDVKGQPETFYSFVREINWEEQEENED